MAPRRRARRRPLRLGRRPSQTHNTIKPPPWLAYLLHHHHTRYRHLDSHSSTALSTASPASTAVDPLRGVSIEPPIPVEKGCGGYDCRGPVLWLRPRLLAPSSVKSSRFQHLLVACRRNNEIQPTENRVSNIEVKTRVVICLKAASQSIAGRHHRLFAASPVTLSGPCM